MDTLSFRPWMPALLAAGAVALAAGCQPNAAPAGGPPPPPTVTVAPVEQRTLTEWSESTGRTEAAEAVEVRPRVTGYLKEVRFQSGQLVKKGDVLFVIDPRWHQADYDRAVAEYERAKVKSEIAEREARRTEKLVATKTISEEEAESRTFAAAEARAALLSAEAQRNSAKLDLDYTEVRAPISGRVSRAYLTEGNYVSGAAGFTTLLTTIVTVEPVHVYVNMDESTYLRFSQLIRSKTFGEGKVPIEMGLSDEAAFPHQGFIESFDNHIDTGSGSILLRAEFPNPDGRIVPGLFVRVRIPTSGQHPTLLVDERAIGTDQAAKFVLSLTSSNTVAYRAVKLGPAVEGQRIVREGLKAGEVIVVNGLKRVFPGMPVTPEKAVAEKAPAVQTAQK